MMDYSMDVRQSALLLKAKCCELAYDCPIVGPLAKLYDEAYATMAHAIAYLLKQVND